MATKELFSRFSDADYFSRVSSTHPLELYVGLDNKGRKAIELHAQFTPRKITGTTAIEVNQYHRDDYNTLRFSLRDEGISGLFYKFCDDLIDLTENIKEVSDGYTVIVNRFFEWKKMFVSSKSNLLTEPQIMGLIGELLYLSGLLQERIGLSSALKSWSGQELTHKDFSFDDSWTEVKSISRGAQLVRISSLEQLDSENDGELVVYSLEKMSTQYNGINLNKLILSIRGMFTVNDEKDIFMAKVALQGYEYNDYYDDFVYEVSGISRYRVSDSFPRLTTGDVPEAIRKAAYELALADLAPYEIKD